MARQRTLYKLYLIINGILPAILSCVIFSYAYLPLKNSSLQIDFLQQKTREMERKLHDSTLTRDEVESQLSKTQLRNRELEAKNKELEYDLNDVDLVAKRLQSDKDIVVKTADREMTEAKVRIEIIIYRY